MMYYAGVDIGSCTTKCVLLNRDKKMAGKTLIPTGTNINKACAEVLARALTSANIRKEHIKTIVTTGYGRYIPPYAANILPEIQAIAKGIQWSRDDEDSENPFRLILDTGGHDTKALVVDESGGVKKFTTNESCAAGTGKFVENIAEIYGYHLEKMSELAFNATQACKLESQCGIFIESEINKLLTAGQKIENVFAALFQNMIQRMMVIVYKLDFPATTLYFTGGFSRLPYAVALLGNLFEQVIVPEDSQFICAIGGALHAYEMALSSPAGAGGEGRNP